MAVSPVRLTLRCYGVGFGDCFLLTFHYPGRRIDRHVLIDFGSTQRPPRATGNLMAAIADDIAAVVGRRLHVLVVTHRHADHVNGFATNASGTGPGDVIARLEPRLVVQPWTEVPEAPGDATGLPAGLGAAADAALRLSLERMREVAAVARVEARHLPKTARDEITFIADDALANRSAVENLARLGRKTKAAYVHHGRRLPALGTLLPGVDVEVLGPRRSPRRTTSPGSARGTPTSSGTSRTSGRSRPPPRSAPATAGSTGCFPARPRSPGATRPSRAAGSRGA